MLPLDVCPQQVATSSRYIFTRLKTSSFCCRHSLWRRQTLTFGEIERERWENNYKITSLASVLCGFRRETHVTSIAWLWRHYPSMLLICKSWWWGHVGTSQIVAYIIYSAGWFGFLQDLLPDRRSEHLCDPPCLPPASFTRHLYMHKREVFPLSLSLSLSLSHSLFLHLSLYLTLMYHIYHMSSSVKCTHWLWYNMPCKNSDEKSSWQARLGGRSLLQRPSSCNLKDKQNRQRFKSWPTTSSQTDHIIFQDSGTKVLCNGRQPCPDVIKQFPKSLAMSLRIDLLSLTLSLSPSTSLSILLILCFLHYIHTSIDDYAVRVGTCCCGSRIHWS